MLAIYQTVEIVILPQEETWWCAYRLMRANGKSERCTNVWTLIGVFSTNQVSITVVLKIFT
jgi:hypothetical protein